MIPDDIHSEILRGCSGGNLLPALRRVNGVAGASALPLVQRFALSAIRQSLESSRPRLWKSHWENVRPMLEEWLGDVYVRDEVDAILQIGDGLRVVSAPRAGRVCVPLVATDFDGELQTFSTCRVLVLAEYPGGGRRELRRPTGSDTSINDAFKNGVTAAVGLLSAKLRGGLLLANRLYSNSFLAQFEDLESVPIEDASIGLGVGIAVVSRLLDLPVCEAAAFTGALAIDGCVGRVGGVEAKVRACLDMGVRRLFVPQCQKSSFADGCGRHDGQRKLELVGVESLEKAVELVFEREAFNDAMRRFRSERGAPIPREDGALKLDQGPVWLLSCVGTADPFGEKSRGSEIVHSEAGPILECCAEIQSRQDLERVVLWYTEGEGSNDMTKRAKDVEMLIRTNSKEEIAIDLRKLCYTAEGGSNRRPVDDPTDYKQLVSAYRSEIEWLEKLTGANAAQLVINVTSGSPQMETMWHLAAELGWFDNLGSAVRVQVRRGWQVAPKESRLRVVDLGLR